MQVNEEGDDDASGEYKRDEDFIGGYEDGEDDDDEDYPSGEPDVSCFFFFKGKHRN
jgi:hypothetical protein